MNFDLGNTIIVGTLYHFIKDTELTLKENIRSPLDVKISEFVSQIFLDRDYAYVIEYINRCCDYEIDVRRAMQHPTSVDKKNDRHNYKSQRFNLSFKCKIVVFFIKTNYFFQNSKKLNYLIRKD